MPKCEFSLTRIFPYKDRIEDSVLIREYMDQRKPVFWHILLSKTEKTMMIYLVFLNQLTLITYV